MFRRAMAAAGAALALTACTNESTNDSTAAAPETTTETTTTTTAAAAPTDVEYTKPGTELKVGDKAVVPYERGGVTVALGITVTAIEQGSAADLAGVNNAEGKVPYFLRFTVSNENGAAIESVSAVPVFGLVEGGSAGFVSGSVDRCEAGRASDEFGVQGAEFESCRIALGTEALPVVGADYDEDSSDLAPEANYRDAPITWSA